jgi:CDP-diacylglycerol--glycerol-3-phosphate 3-phosphatidyltransferase
VVIAANWWGKLKTLTQIVAISLLIISFQLGQWAGIDWARIGKVVLWIALVMTVMSLISYFGSFWRRVVGAQDA